MRMLNHNSALVILGRSFWIMFGPMLLSAAGLIILFNPGTGWQTGADITFLVTLLAMIVGRWLEYCGGEPVTGTGQPSTPADFRRYVLITLIGGALTWVMLNVISNHVMA
jgi:hypothetical protein